MSVPAIGFLGHNLSVFEVFAPIDESIRYLLHRVVTLRNMMRLSRLPLVSQTMMQPLPVRGLGGLRYRHLVLLVSLASQFYFFLLFFTFI